MRKLSLAEQKGRKKMRRAYRRLRDSVTLNERGKRLMRKMKRRIKRIGKGK